MLFCRLSVTRIQHEVGTQQQTAAVDKLMAAGCAGARDRDGLSSFFAAILAKMARLAVCGRCMCRFRFHETESALYVRVCR